MGPIVKIDVVVPVYNAAAFIGDCLAGLRSAGFSDDEITVVDDGSTDDTAAKVRAAGLEPLHMGENTSAPAARNAGASRGTASIILFVDADVVVAPNVKALVKDFFSAHPDYAAVFGAYDAKPRAPARISRIRNLLHRHVHVEGAGEAVTFWTGLGAVRRADFQEVGGFDEDVTMMEDIDLGIRLAARGCRIMLKPELQGTHLKAWSLWGMARTDLLHRAIPWTRLLSTPTAQKLPKTLNIGPTGKLSVLSVLGSLSGLAVSLVNPAIGLSICALALIWLAVVNRRFIAVLIREHSVADAVTALPVLWVHYLMGGLGFFWVKVRS